MDRAVLRADRVGIKSMGRAGRNGSAGDKHAIERMIQSLYDQKYIQIDFY